MPMLPFQLPTQSMKEMISRFIEKYHLTESRGQFTFELRGKKFKLTNFALLSGVYMRMVAYTNVRNMVQDIMTKFQAAIEMESPEMWHDAIKDMGNAYEPFIEFVLDGHSQFHPFFTVLNEMLNDKTIEDSNEIVITLLDIAGMCDHAVSYGLYLVTEFSRLLNEKDIESLIENQHKFPVYMKIAHSKEEAEAWVNEQRKKDEESDDSNDLENMTPIGGMQ